MNITTFYSKVFFVFLTLINVVVYGNEHSPGQGGISYSSRNSDIKINVPSNQGNAPSAIFLQASGTKIFATGKAAQIISQNQARASGDDVSSKANFHEMNLDEIYFVRDQYQKKVGAVYPLKQLAGVYIAALHVLQAGQLDPAISNFKIYGFVGPSGETYDIAILVQHESAFKNFVRMVQNQNSNSIKVYLQHLNIIDQNDIVLTKSSAEILTASAEYLFFTNSANSHVGPISSGAPVYSFERNEAIGSVICLSTMANNQSTAVIRSLRFSALSSARIVELTPDRIQKFNPLNCKIYSGRRGGGD